MSNNIDDQVERKRLYHEQNLQTHLFQNHKKGWVKDLVLDYYVRFINNGVKVDEAFEVHFFFEKPNTQDPAMLTNTRKTLLSYEIKNFKTLRTNDLGRYVIDKPDKALEKIQMAGTLELAQSGDTLNLKHYVAYQQGGPHHLIAAYSWPLEKGPQLTNQLTSPFCDQMLLPPSLGRFRAEFFLYCI